MGAGFFKAVRKATPAHIAGWRLLFFRGSQPFLGLDLLQGTDGGCVSCIFFAGCAMPQGVISDMKIMALFPGDFRV